MFVSAIEKTALVGAQFCYDVPPDVRTCCIFAGHLRIYAVALSALACFFNLIFLEYALDFYSQYYDAVWGQALV